MGCEWGIEFEKNPGNLILNNAGNYTVKLVALRQGIKSPVFEKVTNVTENPVPSAYFSPEYHPYPYVTGEAIQLVNRSKNSDEWKWTFENAIPKESTAQHPIVKFTSAGNHTITLVAKKGNLSSIPYQTRLSINP